MKKILFIILLASGVQAGQLVISSLPRTITQTEHSASLWDTVFIVDADTTTGGRLNWTPTGSAATGIVFQNTSYWRVLFANDSILYGWDSNAVQFRVVQVYSTASNIEVLGLSSTKRGYMIDTCAAWTGTETYSTLNLPRDTQVYYNAHGIISNGSNVVVRNMTMRVNGFAWANGDAYFGNACIYARAGSIEIDHNNLMNASPVWYQREYYPATCVRIAGALTQSSIHDNTITSNATHGIVTVDGGIHQIYNNTQVLDGRNAMEDGPNQFWGLTHSFNILCNRPGRGSRIHHNTLSSGSAYRGGQGIFIVSQDTFSTHTGYIVVDSNTVNVHNGNTSKYAYYQNQGSALKIRAWTHHVKVFDNSLTYTCDTTKTPATGNGGPGYMPIGAAIEYQFYTPTPPTFPLETYVYNNKCSVSVVTNTDDPYYMVAGIRFSNVGFSAEDPTFQWYNNRIAGRMNWAYTFGTNAGVDDPSDAKYVRVRGDTINQLSWAHPVRAIGNSAGRFGSYGNIIQDPYLSGVSQGEITYYGNSPAGAYTPQSGTHNLYFQRTAGINVKGGLNGRPVSGATVTVYNSYGNIVASGTTDSIGGYNPVLSYVWYSENVADSSMNPFSVWVSKRSDVASKSMTVLWNSYTDTVTLVNTEGDGMWPGGPDVVNWRRTAHTGGASGDTTGGGLLIRGPKRRILPLQANKAVLLMKSTTSTSLANLTRFDSAGVPSDSASLSTKGNSYYEAAGAITAGDTALWVCNARSAPTPVTGAQRVYRFNVAVNPMVLIDAVDITTTGWTPLSVAAGLGGGNVMMESRSSGNLNPSNNVTIHRSTTYGGTWGSGVQYWAWSTDQRNGIEPWGAGGAYVTSVGGSTKELHGYRWDGTSFSSDDAPSIAGFSPHREFSCVVTDDSVMHYLFADTSATSCVIHIYKKVGGASWTYDTLYNAGFKVGSGGHLEVGLCYTKSSNTVRAAYTKVETPGNNRDQILVSRKWTGTTWSDELRVSSDDSVVTLAQSTVVPATQGDRAYFAYGQRVSGSWVTELACILGSGATTTTTPEIPSGPVAAAVGISGSVYITGNVRIP